MEDKFVLFLDMLGFSDFVLNNPQETVEKICDTELRQTANASVICSALMVGNFQLPFEVQVSSQNSLYDVKQNHINLHSMSDSLIAWTNDCSFESLVLLTNYAATYIAKTLMLGFPHRGGISKGGIKIIDLPLNGRPQSNAVGAALVKAHKLESKQDWMGCVIDNECLQPFPSDLKSSWISHPQSSLTDFEPPAKAEAIESRFVVDWRVPFKMFGIPVSQDYFQEQFLRYNKQTNESVENKISNTRKFYEAHVH